MKKLETSQIIENVLSNGVITEREVLLLKKRANNGDNEAANFYPGCDTEIEVTEEEYNNMLKNIDYSLLPEGIKFEFK